MNMKHLISTMSGLLVLTLGLGFSEDKPLPPVSYIPVPGAYLGVGVEPLHPAFSAHLPNTLLNGQGVLISRVAKESPADKAGLKVHDILTAYEDQRLFSPDQLVKLIRADKPGRSVKIQFVRHGVLEITAANLSEQPVHMAELDHQHRDLWERQFPWVNSQSRLGFRSPFPKRRDHWNGFDSMTLKNLGGDRFRAEIGYRDKEGKTQIHAFEGTREEIHKQIDEQKDLPVDERNQLLHSLDLHQLPWPSGWAADPLAPLSSWPDPFRDF